MEAPPLRCAIVDGKRAPHKPLLILLVTSWWLRDRREHFVFAELEAPLADLIRAFGPPDTRRPEPALPFWHLQADGIWVVASDSTAFPGPPARRPSARALREGGAFGRFETGFARRLFSSPEVVRVFARNVLDAHFTRETADAVAQRIALLSVGQRPAQATPGNPADQL